jgi:hypothetical protein
MLAAVKTVVIRAPRIRARIVSSLGFMSLFFGFHEPESYTQKATRVIQRYRISIRQVEDAA